MKNLQDDCLYGVGFPFVYVQPNTKLHTTKDEKKKGKVKYIALGAQDLNE